MAEKVLEFQKACGSWCIVQRDFMPGETRGGIMLTRGAQQEFLKETASGTVLKVGDGSSPQSRSVESRPVCAEGDRIWWSRYEERVVEVRDGGDLVAVPFPAIIGVIA